MKVEFKSAKKVVATLVHAKGQFSSATWKSTVKPAAQFKDLEINKITTAVVRSGIDYSNLKSVKEGIANDEREAVGELPWGQWLDFPYIIGHNNKKYVRLYPSKAPNHVPKVKYFVNGKETPKANVLHFLTPSARQRMEQPTANECFTLNVDNILDVIEIKD